MNSFSKSIRSLATLAFTACLFLLGANTLQAQDTYIGGGVEVGVPFFKHSTNIELIGSIAAIPVDLSEGTNAGIGVSARLERELSDKARIFARAGYLTYKNETFADLGSVGDVIGDLTNLEATVTAIPIQGGVKYFLADGLYGSAEVGVTPITTRLDAQLILTLSAKEQHTLLSFAPGIGYEADLGNAKLDIGARYQYVGNGFSGMGLSASVLLPIGR